MNNNGNNNKNIALALITIGNGDWKDMVTRIWNSLDIVEEGYKLERCYDEYFYKLNMKDIDLPSELTNTPMNISDDYTLRIAISTPVDVDHESNTCEILSPWEEEPLPYKIASLLCSEKLIKMPEFKNVIILCDDELEGENRQLRHRLAQLCMDNNKYFWEIGNNTMINIDKIKAWILQEENYCSYHPTNVQRLTGNLELKLQY